MPPAHYINRKLMQWSSQRTVSVLDVNVQGDLEVCSYWVSRALVTFMHYLSTWQPCSVTLGSATLQLGLLNAPTLQWYHLHLILEEIPCTKLLQVHSWHLITLLCLNSASSLVQLILYWCFILYTCGWKHLNPKPNRCTILSQYFCTHYILHLTN